MLLTTEVAPSITQLRRMVEQKAIKLNGKQLTVDDFDKPWPGKDHDHVHSVIVGGKEFHDIKYAPRK